MDNKLFMEVDEKTRDEEQRHLLEVTIEQGDELNAMAKSGGWKIYMDIINLKIQELRDRIEFSGSKLSEREIQYSLGRLSMAREMISLTAGMIEAGVEAGKTIEQQDAEAKQAKTG